mmetsp:Transcript_66801/g.110997  ORF Transcript_66801/g.110997 Transcript_66801/m.110997 type:complete len:260 (+) Transcript_66801:3-782(+)
MCNVDVPVQLHFALFNGSNGFVLKPPAMCSADDSKVPDGSCNNSWPPARTSLHLVTIEILSAHGLPKRGEWRPRLEGRRGGCHSYAPELSGGGTLPRADSVPTSHSVCASLYPIGGFCAIGDVLPLPDSNLSREWHSKRLTSGGCNAIVDQTVYCVAAEPHETFLRLAVSDKEHEVAFETAVLGRLRPGYRVLRLRDPNGTRIDLCYLLLRISFGTVPHRWSTARELRRQSDELQNVLKGYEAELKQLRDSVKVVGALQ